MGIKEDVEEQAKKAADTVKNGHAMGLSSFFAQVRSAQEAEGKDNEPRLTGMQYSKELINTYNGRFKRKYPFHKGKYHQSIPNPDRPGEFFCVQLIDVSKYHGLNIDQVME